MEILIEEFKGRKVLTFKDDKRILLSFGKKKADLIIKYIEQIKDFASKAAGVKKDEVPPVC